MNPVVSESQQGFSPQKKSSNWNILQKIWLHTEMYLINLLKVEVEGWKQGWNIEDSNACELGNAGVKVEIYWVFFHPIFLLS